MITDQSRQELVVWPLGPVVSRYETTGQRARSRRREFLAKGFCDVRARRCLTSWGGSFHGCILPRIDPADDQWPDSVTSRTLNPAPQRTVLFPGFTRSRSGPQTVKRYGLNPRLHQTSKAGRLGGGQGGLANLFILLILVNPFR